jgi:thioredoxin reductase
MQEDAIIVGGSFAGLSAAVMLARARRRVTVIDAGKPRNRFAAAAHGFFSRDGTPPLELNNQARRDLAAYPTATLLEDSVEAASGADGEFTVQLASGRKLAAKKLTLAYGMTDVLPALPGLAQRWGRSVLHCPYCHGYEFADRKLGVLALSPMAALQAQLIAEWGPTRFFLHEQAELDAKLLHELEVRRVTIERTPVVELLGKSPALEGVRLKDGRVVPLDALYIGPQAEPSSALGKQLGCAFDDGPFGPFLRTDDSRQTTVPGVFAAGDIVRAAANAIWAAADGVTAGHRVHMSLVFGAMPPVPPGARAA